MDNHIKKIYPKNGLYELGINTHSHHKDKVIHIFYNGGNMSQCGQCDWGKCEEILLPREYKTSNWKILMDFCIEKQENIFNKYNFNYNFCGNCIASFFALDN